MRTPDLSMLRWVRNEPLGREEAIDILTQLKPQLEEAFGVTSLALFGSTARDEAREDSDVDLLVTFAAPITFRSFMGALHLIEDTLGKKVDLIPEDELRDAFRPSVEQDLIVI